MARREKSLLIIKPDAVKRNLVGKILAQVEEADFKILDLKMLKIGKKQAQKFYGVHNGKPFYKKLVNYISSGSIVPILLEKENAVSELRKLIGNTDPAKAAPNSIRRNFALSITQNSVHASDSKKTFEFESKFFFKNNENKV